MERFMEFDVALQRAAKAHGKDAFLAAYKDVKAALPAYVRAKRLLGLKSAQS